MKLEWRFIIQSENFQYLFYVEVQFGPTFDLALLQKPKFR